MSSDPLGFDLEWSPGYDNILQQIAETDNPDSVEWDKLRNIIKYKVVQNISLFLADSRSPPPPPMFSPIQLPTGGLKLPPFPPRQHNINMIEASPSYMTEGQAAQMKEYIFTQLDEFDSNPPFTIQRVCELCVEPKKHYKSVGKYLRAIEKSLLVTSTWDAFPPLSEHEKDTSARNIVFSDSEQHTVPNTPLFSPIAFLHDDARRSKSRSPPPSPLALGATAIGSAHPDALEPQPLGLVDELDDPRPGHMSDHPTPLTSVTTVDEGKDSNPMIQSLESRFVRGETEEGKRNDNGDAMMVDDDKENTRA